MNLEKFEVMKLFCRILFLIMFVSFYSCEEKELLDQTSIENHSDFKINKSALDIQNEDTDEENLENVMQWVSYLTAQALVRNESAESFFVNTLINRSQENAMSLSDLLDNDNSFRNAFLEEFYYYSGTICRTPTPSGGPKPGDKPGSSTQGFLYIDMLLNDYNFEFYIPNGYNQSLTSVKSSVQVNAVSEGSQGFNHFGRCEVDEIIIYPNTRGNILILKNSEE